MQQNLRIFIFPEKARALLDQNTLSSSAHASYPYYSIEIPLPFHYYVCYINDNHGEHMLDL